MRSSGTSRGRRSAGGRYAVRWEFGTLRASRGRIQFVFGDPRDYDRGVEPPSESDPQVPAPGRSLPPSGGGAWHTTRWSVVLTAGGTDEHARLALSELCSGYWRPLYAFARRSGEHDEAARDAVQGFLTDLLERGDLRNVDPDKGSFRAFLRAAFGHFLSNARTRERACKRGDGRPLLGLDFRASGMPEPEGTEQTPEQAFERAWALAVLERALQRVAGDYATTGKGAVFDALRDRITAGSEGRALREVGAELGLSESAVKVAAHRLRRRFRDALRAEIEDTVADQADVEGELSHLVTVLG